MSTYISIKRAENGFVATVDGGDARDTIAIANTVAELTDILVLWAYPPKPASKKKPATRKA